MVSKGLATQPVVKQQVGSAGLPKTDTCKTKTKTKTKGKEKEKRKKKEEEKKRKKPSFALSSFFF